MKSPRSHLKNLISMMPFKFGITAILMLLSLNVCGQTAQPEPMPPVKLSSEQLLHSAKIYFRDTAELPLLQVTTLSISDSSGRTRKTKPQSSTVIFRGFQLKTETQGDKAQTEVPSLSDPSMRAHETGPGPQRMQDKPEDHLQSSQNDNQWRNNLHLDLPFWAKIFWTKKSRFSVSSALWTSVPGTIFAMLSENPELYVLNAGSAKDKKDQSGEVIARLTPAKTCPAFTMGHEPVPYFPDGICGIAEFQLGDDLSFQRFSFEAPGLPVSAKVDRLGQCTLRRYHVQIEFQKVTLPGSRDPFLVPKQVMTTLETNKGNIVIASTYEPKQSKQ